jgi:hypothetical protein
MLKANPSKFSEVEKQNKLPGRLGSSTTASEHDEVNVISPASIEASEILPECLHRGKGST